MSSGERPKLIIEGDWKSSKSDAAPAAPTTPAAKSAEPASKLVVDSDWKSQAQAEKEKLAEAEKKAPAPKAGARGGKELPPADFKTLVGTLVTQAGMYLGWFPDAQGRAMVSLEYAKFHIDLLAVFAEKTKGNITKEEEEELAAAIHELRGQFVEISQAVAERAKAAAMGKGTGMPGAGGGFGSPGGFAGPGSDGFTFNT